MLNKFINFDINIQVPFWFSPKWSLGIDFEVKKQFYKVGGKIAGLEFHWLGEVKAPRDGEIQLLTNGTVFMGQRLFIFSYIILSLFSILNHLDTLFFI